MKTINKSMRSSRRRMSVDRNIKIQWNEKARQKEARESDNDETSDPKGLSTMAKLLAALCPEHPPRRIIHPRKIYQTLNEKNFNIGIELRTCVHGYLTPLMNQCASLFVFNVQLVCIGKKGTFNRVLMDVEFEDMPGAASAKTAILAHAPFEFEEKQKEKDILVQETNSVESQLSAQINLVGGEGGSKMTTKSEVTSNATQKYFGKGTSGTLANTDGRISSIWWNVKKSNDPSAKDDAGIDANYRFAVLVTRESKAAFRIRLKLCVDAANMGFRYKLKGGSSKVAVKGESSGLLIDPQTHYEGACDGINRMNLGQLRKKGEMAKLARVA